LAKKEISIYRKNKLQIENPSPIAWKDLAAFSRFTQTGYHFPFVSYPKFHDPRSRPARFSL
jgi:hypothetical protein